MVSWFSYNVQSCLTFISNKFKLFLICSASYSLIQLSYWPLQVANWLSQSDSRSMNSSVGRFKLTNSSMDTENYVCFIILSKWIIKCSFLYIWHIVPVVPFFFRNRRLKFYSKTHENLRFIWKNDLRLWW